MLDIDSLVDDLRDLHNGPLVFPEVVRLGDAAVPALERLLRGPADAVHHPRSLAADALAAIKSPQAVGALTRALRDSIARDLPAPLLEAQSILVNHLAQCLSRFPEAEVNEALLAALRRRPYPWCALALGTKGDIRAIPLLIECLYDDPARWAAMQALRLFGDAATGAVARTLLSPREREPPSRVDGRVACAKLLGELAGDGHAQSAVAFATLERALGDRQRAVRLAAALALVRCGTPAAVSVASTLVAHLDEENWARAEEIIAALVCLGSEAERLIVPILMLHPREEGDRRRRLRAVEVAGRLDSAAAVARLTAFHRSRDATLRLAAVAALDRISSAASGAIARFLEDRELTVRERALESLRRRNALDPATAMRMLADPSAKVRKIAAAVLRENPPATALALKQAVWHCGAPMHGIVPRLRLWWHACGLVVRS